MRKAISAVLLPFLLAQFVLGGEKDKETTKKPKGKFTISKETTHVTGPVDKQGYIDYAAALNERLRAGVTPDNNANVLLFKAFGPAPEGGDGMPAEFFKWMGIKAPPPKGDYLVGFSQYMKKHLEVDPERKMADLYKDFDAAQTPWKTKQFPHVAGWLIANEKPLAVIIEATKRAEYFHPLVPGKRDGQSYGLISSLVPGVQRCREAASLLRTRAMLHLGEGRYDEAWQDLLACHRLGRLVARGGTLIESLVGIAIDAIASHSDLVFLEQAKLDAKRARKCLRDLQELPAMPSVADRIALAERFMFLDIVMLLDRRGADYLESFHALVGKDGALGALPEGILEGIDWDPALRSANQWYDRLAAAMKVKDRQARQRQMDKFQADFKDLHYSLTDSERLAKLIREATESARGKGKLVGDALISLMLPAVQKVQQAADRTEQVERNLHVAFALAIHHGDEGRYPKTLEALAPKYLAKVPSDLFAGKALIYRPAEKGYLFYSVGVNGKDEGGRSYNDDPAGDDLRVRMPLAKPR